MKNLFVSILMMFATVNLFAQNDSLPAATDTVSVAVASSNDATKQVADSLYEKEDFAEAVAVYEDIIANKGVSADIYYNLANSYYKLDDVARAILNYERALLLDQGDEDIRANLALARGKTIDKVTSASEMFFVTWWKGLVNSFSVDEWAVIGISSFVLMLIGILVYMFMSSLVVRKIGVYGALLLLFVTIVANVAAMYQRYSITHRDTAIVMSPVVSVKSSPSEASTDLFLMHSGSKVTITDKTMKDWVEVKLEEGKIGWVPLESIEII